MCATLTQRLTWPPSRLRRQATVIVAALAISLPAQATTDLTALSLEQLLQVSIIGASKYEQQQGEIAAAASVITRQEIRAFGWRTLEEALVTLPGLHFTYDRQYRGIGARGLGLPGDLNTRLLVTIDGNRVNDPLFDTAPVGRLLPLDVDLIERIEFIPGPGSALYGQNAMFGVVNIVTRDPRRVGAEAAAGYDGPQNTSELRVGWGGRVGGDVDLLVSLSGMRSQGEDRRFEFGTAGITGVAAGLDGERDYELFANLRRGPWSLQVIAGNRRKDDPTAAYQSDPLVPGQYQADRLAIAQFEYQDRFAADTAQLTARLFYGHERYRSRLNYGGAFDFPADGQWRGGEVRLLYTGLTNRKLLFGVEGQDNFRVEQKVEIPSAQMTKRLISSEDRRYGLFAQDEWHLAPTLLTTLGLRVDRNDKTRTQISPRVGLIWRAHPATTIKGLYGRAHRAPNAYERDYDDGVAMVGNQALAPECIDTFEGVIDQRIGRDLTLRASVYRWRLQSLITMGIDPVSGFSQYQSGLPVRASGVEMSADRTWTNGARLRSSILYQAAHQEGSGRLVNSPRWLAKLNGSSPLPWAGLHAAYEWRFEGARLTRDGTALGGVSISNVALVVDGWIRDLTVTLGVRNLFNKIYAHPAAETNWQNALEQDGRSIRLRFNYRF